MPPNGRAGRPPPPRSGSIPYLFRTAPEPVAGRWLRSLKWARPAGSGRRPADREPREGAGAMAWRSGRPESYLGEPGYRRGYQQDSGRAPGYRDRVDRGDGYPPRRYPAESYPGPAYREEDG